MNVVGPDMEGMGSQVGTNAATAATGNAGAMGAMGAMGAIGAIEAAGPMGDGDRRQEVEDFKEKRVEIENEEDEEEMWRRVREEEGLKL